MTKRRKATKKRARAAGTRSRGVRRGRSLRVALGLLGLVAGFLAAWLWYLDGVIVERMEGQRFAYPSRVYARPLELYPGLPLAPRALEHELVAAGYRQAADAPRPGTYQRSGDRFRIHRRAFRLPDEALEARVLEVSLDAGAVRRLTGADGRSLDIERLEPALIGRIYPAHGEDRRHVPLESVPPLLVETLLAVEDRSFRRHPGLDFSAIVRAAWANLRAREVVQGGSTLTQQLVKNFFLTRQRTFTRKLNEALMALLLERRYDKDVILETYLNEIYLGRDGRHAVHGIGRGAEHWFGREPGDLEADQIALLVGMIRAPSLYDPRVHPDRALARRYRVLRIMAERGLVEPAAAAQLAGRDLAVTPYSAGPGGRYGDFLGLVQKELADDYRRSDLQARGLAIFTGLDPWAQQAAESALAAALPEAERRAGQPPGSLQAALVLSAANTGEVLALMGAREPGAGGFNRALSARRPVGSLLKPLVYLRALADPSRFTLATPLSDEPVTVTLDDGRTWSPGNFRGEYHGIVTVLEALAFSYNAATVRLGMTLGMNEVVATLEALGVERELPPYPSLLLGAAGFSALEMAQLYQALAAGGYPTRLRAVRAVLDGEGRALKRYPLELEGARWPQAAFLVTRALQHAVAQGTGSALVRHLGSGMRAAGKTGTSNDGRDAWFAGYTGSHLAVVWVGRDDNRPASLTGAGAALPVFGDLLRRIPTHPLDPRPPAGLTEAWVVPDGSGLADADCPGAVRVPFVEGSVPERRSDCLQRREERRGWLRRLFDR